MLVIKADLTDSWKVSPRCSFDNYRVWSGNKEAYSTSVQMAKYWKKAPQLTVIYGELGCGKRHLVEALTKELLATEQVSAICYMSGYDCDEELILQNYTSAEALIFRDFCRSWKNEALRKPLALLLENYIKAGKRIVLTGTYPREEWNTLEEYIPGLLADVCCLEVKNPNKEECKELIRYWIKEEKYEKYALDEEMIDYIAVVGTTNVRILMGTLTKVIAYAKLEKQQVITMEFLKKIL